MTEKALAVRKTLKAKKPTFLRQDAHRLPKLAQNWRKPRGRQSKMRYKLRSYRKQPSIGYGSPKEARGLTPGGYEALVVSTLDDLKKAEKAFFLSGTLGIRKRVEIVKKAMQEKLLILNIKDPEAYLKKIEEEQKQKKKASTDRKQKRVKKEAEKKEKEKKEEKKAEDSVETKEKKEKDEKKKILEKK